MTLRRFISLLLGILLLAASVPMRASDTGCPMADDAMNGCCCCGGDAASDDCTGTLATKITCCDAETSATPPTPAPLARHAGCAHGDSALHAIASHFGPPPAGRHPVASAVIPDVIALQQRHTYLLVSSLLI